MQIQQLVKINEELIRENAKSYSSLFGYPKRAEDGKIERLSFYAQLFCQQQIFKSKQAHYSEDENLYRWTDETFIL